ncbi:MAG: hypothetical protein ACK4MV_18670 [Beijerinckiaceae bacterium]
MSDEAAEPREPLQAGRGEESIAGFDGMAFETIEAAVMETERGRWFLREFARRVRAADLDRIESALARIEQRLPASPAPVREAETRIVALSVHQRLVELAAALRGSGVDEEACARIEAQACALVELARRRNIIDACEPPGERRDPAPRTRPAA